MAKSAHKETEIDWHDLKDRLRRQSDAYGVHTSVDSLQQQWMRLFSFFQHSTEGMLLLDDAGNVLLANRESQHLFGKSQDELMASTLFDLLPLEHEVVREPRAWLDAAASMGLYTTGDSMRNRRSFSIRQLGIEEYGEKPFIQVYIREVTDLVRQSEYEAEQLAMLLQMLSHSHEPFILLDASLTIFEFNEAASRMMHAITGRYMRKGLSYLDYANPGRAKEKGWEIFREVLSGLVVEREVKVPSPMGGSPFTWLLTYQPLYDAYGEMAGVFIGGLDQTQERIWQQMLEDQGERLAAWEARGDMAICLLDEDFKIRYAGGGLAAWLGLTGRRIEGSSMRKFLPAKSPLLAQIEQHRINEQTQAYEAIWELVATDKSKFRVKVAMQPIETTEIKAAYLLQLEQSKAADERLQLELALQLLSSGNLTLPVKSFVLFDSLGNSLQQGTWPLPGIDWPAERPAQLRQHLQLLGKQPGTLLKQWEEQGRSPLHFKVKMGEINSHWVLAEEKDASGVSVQLLAMLDDAAAKRVPELEREVGKLKDQVERLSSTGSRWQAAFELINGVFESLSWEYAVDEKRFHFYTPPAKMLFGVRTKQLDLPQLLPFLHPADARQLMQLLAEPPAASALLKGLLRVRNQEDTFDNWHYSLMAAGETGRWRGLWYRPIDTDSNLSIEHFLGFSRFLDDIGWGALILDKQMRLEHASALAIDWLNLPEHWALEVFDKLEAVQQTRLAAEACGFREPGSLYQFEYFNAYTQRWLFVWIYTTQSIRAVYLQLMK